MNPLLAGAIGTALRLILAGSLLSLALRRVPTQLRARAAASSQAALRRLRVPLIRS
jgi:hypothetical protein